MWYSCSLNIYYLVKIKYNRRDNYIKSKIEPWLHGLPALVALAIISACLAGQLINGVYSGTCAPLTHQPPHCYGMPDGKVVDGFTILCGRGDDAKVLIYIVGIVGFLLPPIIIGVSLGMIYKNVLMQEQRIGRYGAGTLNVNSASAAANGSGGASTGNHRKGSTSIVSTLKASVSSRFLSRGRSSVSAASNSDQGSRAVMYKAFAYALAFFITWIWMIVYMFLDIAGAWVHTIYVFLNDVPVPAWQLPYDYCWQFLQQYQGFWTLVVFLQPKASRIKNSSGVCLFRAFGIALWSGLTGKKPAPHRKRAAEKPPPAPKSSQTASSADIPTTGGTQFRTSGQARVSFLGEVCVRE